MIVPASPGSEPASTLPSPSLQAQVGPVDSSPGPSHDSHHQSQLSHSPFGPHPTLSLLNEISSSNAGSRSIAGMLDPRPCGYPSHKVFDMLTGAGPAPTTHHIQSQRSADRLNATSIPLGHSIGLAATEDPNRSGGLEGPSSSTMVGLNHKVHRYKSTNQPDKHGNSDDEDSGSPSPSLIRHHPRNQQASAPGPFRRDAPAPSHLPTAAVPITQSIPHEHRPSVALNPSASKPFFNQISFLVRAREAWNQERQRYARLIKTDGHIPLDDVEGQTRLPTDDSRPKSRPRTSTLNTREVALWRWMNLDDLDAFLQEFYEYYCGKGIWAIGLSRLRDLTTIGFVGSFTTFLMGFIDYSTFRMQSWSLFPGQPPGTFLVIKLNAQEFICDDRNHPSTNHLQLVTSHLSILLGDTNICTWWNTIQSVLSKSYSPPTASSTSVLKHLGGVLKLKVPED